MSSQQRMHFFNVYIWPYRQDDIQNVAISLMMANTLLLQSNSDGTGIRAESVYEGLPIWKTLLPFYIMYILNIRYTRLCSARRTCNPLSSLEQGHARPGWTCLDLCN